jgi:hypothetical protein
MAAVEPSVLRGNACAASCWPFGYEHPHCLASIGRSRQDVPPMWLDESGRQQPVRARLRCGPDAPVYSSRSSGAIR